MDRNIKFFAKLFAACKVATREGGVDRNKLSIISHFDFGPSPPARVAWIETTICMQFQQKITVATREGGVDRNFSLSTDAGIQGVVATREGGVDRNR